MNWKGVLRGEGRFLAVAVTPFMLPSTWPGLLTSDSPTGGSQHSLLRSGEQRPHAHTATRVALPGAAVVPQSCLSRSEGGGVSCALSLSPSSSLESGSSGAGPGRGRSSRVTLCLPISRSCAACARLCQVAVCTSQGHLRPGVLPLPCPSPFPSSIPVPSSGGATQVTGCSPPRASLRPPPALCHSLPARGLCCPQIPSSWDPQTCTHRLASARTLSPQPLHSDVHIR